HRRGSVRAPHRALPYAGADAMIVALLACHTPDVAATATEPTMTATVTAAKVGKDQPVELTVQGDAPQGWTLEIGAPTSEGLSVTASDPAQNGSARAPA